MNAKRPKKETPSDSRDAKVGLGYSFGDALTQCTERMANPQPRIEAFRSPPLSGTSRNTDYIDLDVGI